MSPKKSAVPLHDLPTIEQRIEAALVKHGVTPKSSSAQAVSQMPAAPPRAPVDEALEACWMANQRIHDVLSTLLSRIDVVLLPQQDSASSNGGTVPSPHRGALANQMTNLADSMNSAAGVLTDVLQRLTL